LEKTIELMQRIERTGVCCIAVHCRTPSQRPRERGDQSVFKRLADSISIPVIANGDIFKHGNIDQIMTETSASLYHCLYCLYAYIKTTINVIPDVRGVMLARAAMWNVSIFRTEGPLPVEQVMRRYLELAIDLASPFKHVKYIFMQMVGSHEVGIGKAIRHARTYKEIW
jgi:tRNA-dihydrouridine synthase 2